MHTTVPPKGVVPEEWHPAENLEPQVIKEHYDRADDHSEGPQAWHLLDMALASHNYELFTGGLNAFGRSIISIERYYNNLGKAQRRRESIDHDFDYLDARLVRAHQPALKARMDRREITEEEMQQVHADLLPITDVALSRSGKSEPNIHQAIRVRHLIGSEVITRTGYPGYFPQLNSRRENKGKYQSFIKNLEDKRTLRLHFAPELRSIPGGILGISIGSIALDVWSGRLRVDNELGALQLTHKAIKTEHTLGQRSEIVDQMTGICLSLINESWEDLLQ